MVKVGFLLQRSRVQWLTDKVCNVIDGVSHVSRIAALVDCDLELTRQAIAHLLLVRIPSPVRPPY